MKRTVPVLLLALTFEAQSGIGQKAPQNLTDQQKLGRRFVAQYCAVCHLPSGPGARTYGPSLNRTTLADDDDAMRQTLLEGNTRMPGFKYFLQPAQVDAIIAYLRTVPPPTPQATPQGKSDVD